MCFKSVSIKPSRCKQISLLIITYATLSTKEDSQMLQDILKKIMDFLFQVIVTGNKVCFGVLVWKHVKRRVNGAGWICSQGIKLGCEA